MKAGELKKVFSECKEITEVEKIRNEINHKTTTKIKTFYTRIKSFQDEIETINIFAEQQIKKILSNSESKKRVNTITQFLYDIIFPGIEEIIKAGTLYEQYKNWCKQESNERIYGKNKFYELLKLEPRARHKHLSIGDYFEFELNTKQITPEYEIPF